MCLCAWKGGWGVGGRTEQNETQSTRSSEATLKSVVSGESRKGHRQGVTDQISLFAQIPLAAVWGMDRKKASREAVAVAIMALPQHWECGWREAIWELAGKLAEAGDIRFSGSCSP